MTHFAQTKQMFNLPAGVIYLDGNSLGPLPKAVSARMHETLHAEWGEMLIRGWNQAGWMRQPRDCGDRIGRLIGAPAGSVIVGDTLSIRVFQALAAALQFNPQRKVILSDSGNFPSDLYVAGGLIDALGQDLELRLVEPDAVMEALDESVAVVMLTEVDFRTGRLHDMPAVSAAARAVGAVSVWDLAHSAGALPVRVQQAGADFAVGCTYKYLNAGPGAPAFIYVSPERVDDVQPILSGWLGHSTPFGFELDYTPAPGIDRMRIGTPPVLAMAALECALDVWDGVELEDVRTRSIELSELFIREVEQHCPQLQLASPREPKARGSQVSFLFEHGYAVMQALISRGVIGDFRAPNAIRFGFTPLYLDERDILAASAILAEIMQTHSWDQAKFHARAAVT